MFDWELGVGRVNLTGKFDRWLFVGQGDLTGLHCSVSSYLIESREILLSSCLVALLSFV